jgi:GT2 family glycosyltransferase
VSDPAQISVAVATRDRPEGLRRCLEALLSDDVVPAELIVVDQSSDEAGRQVVGSLGRDGVELVYVHQAGSGLSRSRNEALRRATKPVVAVTDDDCVPAPGWVATLGGALASTDPPAAVTGPILPLGPPAPELHPVSSRTGTERREFRGRDIPWAAGSGANVAVRREWLDRVGGYDERLGAGSPGRAGEDIDLLFRLLRAGGHIRYEPGAVVHHEQQDRERRLATRSSYGFGIGACCGLWLRRGNAYAIVLLLRWLASRVRRAAVGLVRRTPDALREELLVLVGTLRGLVYGLRLGTTEGGGGDEVTR